MSVAHKEVDYSHVSTFLLSTVHRIFNYSPLISTGQSIKPVNNIIIINIIMQIVYAEEEHGDCCNRSSRHFDSRVFPLEMIFTICKASDEYETKTDYKRISSSYSSYLTKSRLVLSIVHCCG